MSLSSDDEEFDDLCWDRLQVHDSTVERAARSSPGNTLSSAQPEAFQHLLLDSRGIHTSAHDSSYSVDICQDCYTALAKDKMPKFALANGLY